MVKVLISRFLCSNTSNGQGSTTPSVDKGARKGLRSLQVVAMVPGEKDIATLESLSSLNCFGDIGLRVQVKPEIFYYELDAVDDDEAGEDFKMSDDSEDE